MKKALKRVGLVLGVATVAGAVAYAVKKVKEMDDFDIDGVDYDDSLDDDDDEDFDEDFCDEDFGDDSDFCATPDNTYDINGENLTVKEIKDKLLEYYSGEDISDLSEDDLVDLLRSTVSDDNSEDDKASEDSEIDTFALINGNTREEVVDILVEADSAQYEKDTLLAMSDGELTQVYADWKVLQSK